MKTKDIINRVKTKGENIDSSDEDDLDRKEERSSRRTARPSGGEGEVLDRLNHAGKLLWSQDADKYKNEPKYARTKDSDEEGEKHLHWRKDWHPWVKHHVHGGRGV